MNTMTNEVQMIPVPPEAQALSVQSGTWNEQAAGLVVADQASYEEAARFLEGCRAFRKEADDKMRPAIDAAHKAHKAMVKVLADILAPVEAAESAVRGKAARYLEDQENRRREIQRRVDEEERRRQQEMESARQAEIARERQARDEALEREIEAREAAGAGQEEILAVIETAAAMAEPEPVLPVYVPAPVVAPLVDKVKGAGLTYQYSAQVTNLGALIKAAAANPAMEAYLMPNPVALNAIARAQKEAMRIPGVAIVKKANVR